MTLSVTKITRSAWADVNGCKLSVFVALLTMIAVLGMMTAPVMSLQVEFVQLANKLDAQYRWLLTGLAQWAVLALMSLFYAGFIQIGIKRVKDEPISPFEILAHVNHWLIITNVLMLLLAIEMMAFAYLIPSRAGIVNLFVLPILVIALPVAVLCETNTLHAWLAGLKIGLKNLPQILVLMAIVSLSMSFGAMLLGIGLFWTIPFKLLIIARIYLMLEQQGEFVQFAESDRNVYLEIIIAVLLIVAVGFLSLQTMIYPTALFEQLASLGQPQSVFPGIN